MKTVFGVQTSWIHILYWLLSSGCQWSASVCLLWYWRSAVESKLSRTTKEILQPTITCGKNMKMVVLRRDQILRKTPPILPLKKAAQNSKCLPISLNISMSYFNYSILFLFNWNIWIILFKYFHARYYNKDIYILILLFYFYSSQLLYKFVWNFVYMYD